MEFISVYIVMLVVYVVVDFIWITFFMQPYFTANLGHLLRAVSYTHLTLPTICSV